MAAIYFPPGFKALGRIPTLLSNFPECAMDTKPPEPNYLPDPRIIVEKLLYDNLDVSVYLGTCLDLAETKVAVKFSSVCRLLPERAVYDKLKALQGKCIPKLYGMYFGESVWDKRKELACIVLEYGESVECTVDALPRNDKSVHLI